MTLPNERKVNCLKCKPLWIGISLGVLGSVLLGFAVFNQSFYGDNVHAFVDFIRFTIIGVGLFGTILGSYFLIKGYCFKGDGMDFLAWGIICAIISVFLIMILVYFVPMAYEESVIRSMNDTSERMIYAETMNCRSIQWHDRSNSFSDFQYQLRFGDTWNSYFSLSSDGIDNRIKECRN